MHHNDRRERIALGAIIFPALAVILIATYPMRYSPPPPKPETATERYDKAAVDARKWIGAAQEHADSKILCEKKPDGSDCTEPYHNALDLAAQWLAAESAQQMVIWTIAQFFVGFLGLGGVIATVIYTHKTLRLADRTSRAQLRAYISVDARETERAFEINGNRLVVRTDMINRGQTPAYKVRIKSRFKFVTSRLPDAFDFSISDRDSSQITLGAQQSVSMVCVDEQNAVEPAAMTATAMAIAKLRIMLYGVVTYETVFKEKATTEFCYFSHWTDGRIEWIAAPNHNDAT